MHHRANTDCHPSEMRGVVLSKKLWTISFNYRISALLEGLRGACENPRGAQEWRRMQVCCLWSWDWMMNVWCLDEPPPSVFSSSSDKFLFLWWCIWGLWTAGSSLLSWLLLCLSPPETPVDQITLARPWWNHGTESSITATKFTWFSSIISDMMWLRLRDR